MEMLKAKWNKRMFKVAVINQEQGYALLCDQQQTGYTGKFAAPLHEIQLYVGKQQVTDEEAV